MKKSDLTSYAINFTSFLIKHIKVNTVILFGSVARGDFDEKSDIDIFIETNQPKEKIEKILELYNKSEDNEKYRLIGIKNEIKIKTGNLDKWKSLKESIISSGIFLYGKYTATPENIKPHYLFTTSLKNIQKTKKIYIWRKLYGYKQKVGKKIYETKGIINKRIGYGGFIISSDKYEDVIKILKKHKVNYKIYEIYL